jgi:hypothetical protein
LIENLGVFVAVPFRLLNMLFSDHRAARAMKTGAVDQTGLKSLQLLAGDNVIVNVDNHDRSFLRRLAFSIRERQRAAKREKIGVME